MRFTSNNQSGQKEKNEDISTLKKNMSKTSFKSPSTKNLHNFDYKSSSPKAFYGNVGNKSPQKSLSPSATLTKITKYAANNSFYNKNSQRDLKLPPERKSSKKVDLR